MMLHNRITIFLNIGYHPKFWRTQINTVFCKLDLFPLPDEGWVILVPTLLGPLDNPCQHNYRYVNTSDITGPVTGLDFSDLAWSSIWIACPWSDTYILQTSKSCFPNMTKKEMEDVHSLRLNKDVKILYVDKAITCLCLVNLNIRISWTLCRVKGLRSSAQRSYG
jgi:hypothetical protein